MCNIRLDACKEGDRLERIVSNLGKAKLKLDEAFFYLDEIEELIQEDELSETAGSKVSQATERLTTELSALSGRVAELQDILQALDEREDAAGDSGE
jgi:phage shock protein A